MKEQDPQEPTMGMLGDPLGLYGEEQAERARKFVNTLMRVSRWYHRDDPWASDEDNRWDALEVLRSCWDCGVAGDRAHWTQEMNEFRARLEKLEHRADIHPRQAAFAYLFAWALSQTVDERKDYYRQHFSWWNDDDPPEGVA